MNNYRAVALTEGFEESSDRDEMVAAWQHLVDTGLAWSLQGSFGRTAAVLLKQGIIEARTPTAVRVAGLVPKET